MTRVVVIGGGIAGISAAAALSENADVTVLEAEDSLGYHASGRAAGMFLADYGNDTIRALNRASQDWHEAHDILKPRMMMMVGKDHEEEGFRHEAAGFALTDITMDEARKLVPILADDLQFAAAREDVFELDTDRCLQAFRKAALANGARIITGARVTEITPGWRVETTAGAFEADHLVNAGGAWADAVARLAGVAPIGLQPLRRSMARLPAPGGHDTRNWPFLDGVGETWYAKPDAGGLIVSPSEEDPVEPCDAWADDMVIAEGLARWEAVVTTPVTRVETTWAGLRTFASDRTLVLGEAPDKSGFWWCAAQGGYGFQTAPAAARLLASQMLDQTSELADDVVAALSPARFA